MIIEPGRVVGGDYLKEKRKSFRLFAAYLHIRV